VAPIAEHLSARKRADRAYRRRLVLNGQCVRCGKRREPEQTGQRCGQCKAKATEAAWQRRQRNPPRKKGPKPRTERWNFGTDDLITEHIKLAKALAWKAKGRIPSSSSVDIDDMVGDALLGLVVAGRTFEESYQVPFGAWAATRIRGAIWDGVRRWNYLHQKQPPQFVELPSD
jgi:hypothetical protein